MSERLILANLFIFRILVKIGQKNLSKPKTRFCGIVMDNKKTITQLKCFIVENNEALYWLLENTSDIVDMIQWLTILLS